MNLIKNYEVKTLDKYEYKLKLEQLKNLVNEGDYATAGQIVDSVNWRKVRNSATLCMVGDVYNQLGRYEESKEIYLMAYDHAPIGRNIIAKLTEVAIKSNSLAEAEEYYNEYSEIAGNDTQKLVLRYQLSTLKGEPIQNRISILEELKEREYTEEWAYELARVYSEAGRTRECVEVCDELDLWFGDGEYVEKALALKQNFEPLTQMQADKVEKFRKQREEIIVPVTVPEDTRTNVADFLTGASTPAEDPHKFDTMNLQAELQKSMQQLMDAKEHGEVSDTMENIMKMVEDIPELKKEDTAPVADTVVLPTVEELVAERLKANVEAEAAKAAEAMLESPEEEAAVEIPVAAAVAGTVAAGVAATAMTASEDDAELSEEELLEKQITGQLSIEDILAEWERTKAATEEAIVEAEQMQQTHLENSKTQAIAQTQEMRAKLEAMEAAKAAEEEAARIAAEEEAAKAASLTEADIDAMLLTPDISSFFAEVDKITKPTPVAPAVPEVELPVLDTPEKVVAEPPVLEMPATEAPTDEDIDAQLIMPDITGMMEEAEEEPVMEATPVAEIPAEPIIPEVPVEPVIPEAPAAPIVPEMEMPSLVVDPETLFAESKQPVVDEIPLPEDIMAELVQKEAESTPMNGGEVVLTKEQRALFPYFLPVPGMEPQICQVLKDCLAKKKTITSLTGNITIEGPDGSGKTVLAASLIKALQMMTDEAEGRTGKISATALNKKDFTTLLPKLQGGYLIIEKAGNLMPETIQKISRAMEGNTQGLTVIMEDSKSRMRAILAQNKGFAQKFTSNITIPVFTIDELVDFGKSYAKEMECTIDEMGILALYNRISNIQKHDKATTLTEVREIVDQAIESAESGGGMKKTFGSLFSKRYNENDFLILREKDFEN